MNTSHNTILITGGSAGIGFEIAKAMVAKNNKVIITGRNEERLQRALEQLPNAVGIATDVTQADEVDQLVKRIITDFPELTMVVNNAGQAFVHSLSEETNTFDNAREEMLTNYLSIIRLNEKLLPLLKKKPEAAIVHVSSIVAFVPNHKLATYGASKAALHSYSLSLRLALAKDTSVKVFELMPPLVNTDFSQSIGGATNGIPAADVAQELLQALENDQYEIHVGRTADIYSLSRKSPAEALLAMNP